MTTSHDPMLIEKLNLARRIESYLDAVEREGQDLGPWETEILARVFALLEIHYHTACEDVMYQLEHPDLHGTEKARAAFASGPTLSIAEQRRKSCESAGGLVKPLPEDGGRSS